MEVIKGVKINGLGLIFHKSNAIAFGDLHLGYEEGLISQGVFLPKFNFKDIKNKISLMLGEKNFEKTIVLGDVKHKFGIVNKREEKEISEIFSYLKSRSKEVIVIKGNHDNGLESLFEKIGITFVNSYLLSPEKTLFLHGDETPTKDMLRGVRIIVIGHEHAAVSLRDGAKIETYKCFLKGNYKGKTLFVLPSLSSYSSGTDLTREMPLSPILREISLDNFEVYIVEKDVYFFGKLKNIL